MSDTCYWGRAGVRQHAATQDLQDSTVASLPHHSFASCCNLVLKRMCPITLTHTAPLNHECSILAPSPPSLPRPRT